jgi:hypothetical protein
LGVAGFGWAVVLFWVVAKTLIFFWWFVGGVIFHFFACRDYTESNTVSCWGVKQNPSLWG